MIAPQFSNRGDRFITAPQAVQRISFPVERAIGPVGFRRDHAIEILNRLIVFVVIERAGPRIIGAVAAPPAAATRASPGAEWALHIHVHLGEHGFHLRQIDSQGFQIERF